MGRSSDFLNVMWLARRLGLAKRFARGQETSPDSKPGLLWGQSEVSFCCRFCWELFLFTLEATEGALTTRRPSEAALGSPAECEAMRGPLGTA